MSGELFADPTKYAEASVLPPPPPITPDIPPVAATWIEQAARALGLSAALGDPIDTAEGQKGHAERQAMTADAAAKFPANEEASAAKMKGLEEQLPQMASSLAGAVAGALGGVLQPLTQIPAQLAQTGQQLLQQGMGAMEKGAEVPAPADLAGVGLGDEFGSGAGEFGGGGGGESGAGGGAGGGAGFGATTPTAMLGPPATPSATTTPTSARAMPPIPPAAAPAATGPMGGMGGMPMMPHGGMHGGGADGKDSKADTKRVSVPSVKNGAPIQGRITTPPPAPTITKRVDGQPVTSKRIIIPNDRGGEKNESDDGSGR